MLLKTDKKDFNFCFNTSSWRDDAPESWILPCINTATLKEILFSLYMLMRYLDLGEHKEYKLLSCKNSNDGLTLPRGVELITWCSKRLRVGSIPFENCFPTTPIGNFSKIYDLVIKATEERND